MIFFLIVVFVNNKMLFLAGLIWKNTEITASVPMHLPNQSIPRPSRDVLEYMRSDMFALCSIAYWIYRFSRVKFMV